MNINKQIHLLDCTLRDGGHLNEGNFGKEVIKAVVQKLVEAKVDIIEVGFLWDKIYGDDVARYYTIEDVKKILPEYTGESKFSLMADFIDLEHLEPYDGTIEYIRLSFKRHRLEWALKTARILMEKGYKIFINPVNCNVYTDEQYINVIKQVNDLKPYAFSIVDTFGVMRLRDLTYRYGLVESNLNKDIKIGLHLHENLGLAYSLAQQFIQLSAPQRDIIIDGSLLGMGRVPGNLCIEQIMDHLNYEYGHKYDVEPIFDAIDDFIAPLKRKIPWGYAIPYALSAKYNLHRTYAEFLMNKWKLRTSDIERILPKIDKSQAELFNEEYIEDLYRKYMSVEVDDKMAVNEIGNKIRNRNILLIAPGASINQAEDQIKKYAKENNSINIGIHCVPEFVKLDYAFFTNIKRFEILKEDVSLEKIIISSNLKRYEISNNVKNVINYSELTYHDDEYCDDSMLMMLNLLKRIGITEITVVGFDGVINGKGDFYIENLSRTDCEDAYSDKIYSLLKKSYKGLSINFLTKSYYENYKEE